MKSRELNVLMHLYMHKSIALPMKTKFLLTMQSLISKKNAPRLDFVLPWRELWAESMELLLRSKKHINISSDSVNSKYINSLFDFMHKSRVYIPEEDARAIIDMAMGYFSDLRFASSMEGCLLLTHCLPTHISLYDEYLDAFMQVYTSIEHNIHWDVAWLTVLARARKYAVRFDWSRLS